MSRFSPPESITSSTATASETGFFVQSLPSQARRRFSLKELRSKVPFLPMGEADVPYGKDIAEIVMELREQYGNLYKNYLAVRRYVGGKDSEKKLEGLTRELKALMAHLPGIREAVAVFQSGLTKYRPLPNKFEYHAMNAINESMPHLFMALCEPEMLQVIFRETDGIKQEGMKQSGKDHYFLNAKDYKEKLRGALDGQQYETLLGNVSGTLEKLASILGQFHKVANLAKPLQQDEIRQLFHEALSKILSPNYSLEIVVGFGGSTDEINVRLASYLIPALETMKLFHANGVTPPRLVIATGHDIAREINGMDQELLQKNQQGAVALLESFIKRFYPELADQFTFFHYKYRPDEVAEQVRTLESCRRLCMTKHHDEVAEQVRTLEGFDMLQIESHIHAVPMIAQVNAQLEKLAKHSNKYGTHDGLSYEEHLRQAMQYAATHPVIFRNLARKDDPDKTRGVMKFGGAGEGAFDCVQKLLVTFLPENSEYYRTNSTSASGEFKPLHLRIDSVKPPYYSAGGHEISVSKVAEMDIDSFVKAIETGYLGRASGIEDMELVKRVIGLGAYFEFLKEHATR